MTKQQEGSVAAGLYAWLWKWRAEPSSGGARSICPDSGQWKEAAAPAQQPSEHPPSGQKVALPTPLLLGPCANGTLSGGPGAEGRAAVTNPEMPHVCRCYKGIRP